MRNKITKDSLNPIVLALVGTPEAAETWWNTYNLHFDGTPISILSLRPEEVKSYLLSYCYAS
jgi:hypothetical protein